MATVNVHYYRETLQLEKLEFGSFATTQRWWEHITSADPHLHSETTADRRVTA